MLELKNISRVYKQKHGPEVWALNDVSLVFPEKGMVFVLGKSGSGKSTLLNVIGGLDKYTAGDLIVKGKSTKTFKQSEFDSYRNTMIGFIFQEYNVLDDFTVGQNIGIALELQGKKAESKTINEYLDILDMQGYATRKPNTLSGGQKQRVAIARALVKNPEVIMADEPTGALDSATGKQLFETLKKLSHDKLVIVVTHDHEFAETYGDRIIEFSDGKIIRDVSKVTKEINNENKIITDDGITLKKGYELTTDDFEAINRYLRQKGSESHIRFLTNHTSFIDTKPLDIATNTNELTLIKSRLPFKSALKIGASALKHKTFRLVLSILLASTAFGMFGLTDAIGSFNRFQSTENTMMNIGLEYSAVRKINRQVYGDFAYEMNTRLTNEDLTSLNTLNDGLDFTTVINNTNTYVDSIYDKAKLSEDSLLSINTPSIVSLKTEDLETYALEMLAGTLPSTEFEIAISEFTYKVFDTFDYTSSGSVRETINTPADMIGKRLFSEYIVTGVVKTNLEMERFIVSAEDIERRPFLAFNRSQFSDYLTSSFNGAIFYHQDAYDKLIKINSVYNILGSKNHSIVTNQTTNEGIYLQTYRPLETLKDSENVIFFDSLKTLETMSDNEVIIDATAIKGLIPSFKLAVENASNELVNEIIATNANDAYIEAYLKDNYEYHGIPSASNIKPYTTWTSQEQEEYRSYYVIALLSPWGLYYRNPYQSSLVGKTVITQKVISKAQASVSAFNTNITIVDYESAQMHTTTKPISIVGVEFEYFAFANAPDDSYFTQNIYITKSLATSLELSEVNIFDRAITYHGANRALVHELVNLNKTGIGKTDSGNYFRLSNEVANLVDSIGTTLEILTSVFITIGIIFAVFAALLLINFITLSVAFKKQEIGILRAIGARGQDVSLIFLNEAGIIALINFTLATIATLVVARILNNSLFTGLGLNLSVVNVTLRQIILMLLIAFGIAALSSFIPVYRLSRKKPIDAIKGR